MMIVDQHRQGMQGAPRHRQTLFSTTIAELTEQPLPIRRQWLRSIMILREYQARQRGEHPRQRTQRRILQRWVQQGRRFDLRLYQSIMERSDDAIATAKNHWSVKDGTPSVGWRRHPARLRNRSDLNRDVQREEAGILEEDRQGERPPPEPPPPEESSTVPRKRRRIDDNKQTDRTSRRRRRRNAQVAQMQVNLNGMQRSRKRKRGTPDLEPEDPSSTLLHYFPNKKNST